MTWLSVLRGLAFLRMDQVVSRSVQQTFNVDMSSWHIDWLLSKVWQNLACLISHVTTCGCAQHHHDNFWMQ